MKSFETSQDPPRKYQTDDEDLDLQTIVESMPNGVVVVNQSGIIYACNSEMEKLFGYDRNELRGEKLEILVPEASRAVHPSYREGFMKQPSKRKMGAGRDLMGRAKDGTQIPVEIGLNFLNFNGRHFAIAAVVDLRERKRQDEKFRTIVNSVPNGIVMVNAEGIIQLCNTELERLFGYEPGELNGHKIETLVPLRYRHNHPGFRHSFQLSPHKRQMGVGRDLRGLKKDGTEIPVEIGLNPIETAEGIQVLASIVDITERSKVESRLKTAYDEVQQKNLEMEQFVYTVSHDLKAPLVTSMSFLGFLREDLAEGRLADVHDSMERLEKAHIKMQELIQDLLTLSRAGRMELHLSMVPMRSLVNEVVEDLSQKFAEKRFKIEILELPELYVDGKRLIQVFENLFTNALKYAATAAEPTLQIYFRDTEEEYVICVKDNGPGVSPEYHKKIFGLFQRLDNKQEGTGVGLTIVARVMQLHGGRVWVESKEGEGAEFCLAFPKKRAPIEGAHGE